MTDTGEQPTEINEQHAPEAPKRKLRVRWTDVVIFGVIVIVIIGMAVFIVNKLSLKHEVSQARVVTDKVVADMAKQNTAAIRSLGNKQFQTDHTAAELDSALTFKTSPPIKFSELYGDTKPTVDQQIVANNARGKHVVIIYRYDKLKIPFFVRVDTIQTPGSNAWQLQALSANPDESKLLGQQQ